MSMDVAERDAGNKVRKSGGLVSKSVKRKYLKGGQVVINGEKFILFEGFPIRKY